MKYAKVEGKQNLVRNLETNAIINTNAAEYNQYISLRRMKQNEETKINSLENEINCIKNDLSEIKDLLRSMVNGSK
jgi:hypothetical protein